MRPAEVCGCERYPSSARSAITFRIDAGLRASSRNFEIVRDPTGSPFSMYARTMAIRISRYLDLSGASVLIALRLQLPYYDSNGLKPKGQWIDFNIDPVPELIEYRIPPSRRLPVGSAEDSSKLA